MKAEQTLSAIFRQLRHCLRKPSPSLSPSPPLSNVAYLRHLSVPRQSFRHAPQPPYSLSYLQTRQVSSSAPASTSALAPSPSSSDESELPSKKPPAYELTFTCKPCQHRSTHAVSKLGYHKGTVLVTCPECKNRHLICDHLKIFADQSITIEDIMRQKGELVKRGRLVGEGHVEFWDDGTQTERNSVQES